MTDKHAAGYVRVSSEEQAAHGISIDAQRAILEGWAAMTQAGPMVIYQDPGFSGKNMERPALRQLLADVRAGRVSVVVVWKLDRLSRSLRDTLAIIEDELQPRGVSLVSTTESIDTATPAGRMMLNMLASFAQLEREQDADRVLMAHRHLAEDCRYLGGHVPLGYRVDETRHLCLDPVTAPVVRRVFQLYLSRAGYAEILDYLNGAALGFSRRRTPWKKSDLHYMLSNEIYAGTYVHRLGMDKRSKAARPEVIRVPGGVPAILTPEEWQRVCRLREENAAHAAAYTARTVYPLSGLVRCGVCGAVMPLNHGGKDRAGTVQRYYTCRRRCVRPARLEPLEAHVSQAAAFLAGQGEAITRACAVANDYAQARDSDHAADALQVEKRLQQLRRRKAQLVAFVAESGAAAPRALADELRRLDAEEAAVLARLEALRRPSARYSAPAVLSALQALQGIEKSPPAQRRALFQEALSAVQIFPDEIRVVLAWHTCDGDDPPANVCHISPRASSSAAVPSIRVTPAAPACLP